MGGRLAGEYSGIIGWLVSNLETATLSDVAKRFNRDLSTISRVVRNIEIHQSKSKEFKKQTDFTLKDLNE